MSKKAGIILTVIFFAAAALYFTFLGRTANFPDPDSFYHAKMAALMRDNLVIKEFHWIKFADFTQKFTDQHFLYHIFLIPFTYLVNPLIGLKIATIILAIGVLIAFYFLLKRLGARWPLLFTAVLLFVTPFIFRINLAKAIAFSLLILFAATALLARKKNFGLAMLSFFYVWSYGGWILIILLTTSFFLADFLIKKELNFKPIINVAAGCALGIIINPFFPNNLLFYWEQIVQIGFINYQDKIPVGLEWYPYKILDFLSAIIFPVILSFIAFALWAKKIKNEQRQNTLDKKAISEKFSIIFAIFIFSLFLGVWTLKSQRFVEYFAPFFTLASALLITFSLPRNFSLKDIGDFLGTKIFPKLFLFIYSCLIIGFFFALSALKLESQFTKQFNFNYLKEPSEWLKNNTPAGSTIFHGSWGDFPMLFYHNSQNVYLSGMDPTFFYRFNPELYKEWLGIASGQIKNDLADKIKNDFGASFVLVKKNENKLKENLEKDGFTKKFENNEATIYSIKPL